MIKINSKYFFDRDAFNYILYEKVKNKKMIWNDDRTEKIRCENYGKYEYKWLGYYGRMESLFKGMTEHLAKNMQGDFKCLDDLCRAITDTHNSIDYASIARRAK